MRLHRPATGRTWTVTLTPALYQAPLASRIRKAAGRRHRLRAAARVLPRRGRSGAAGDIEPGPARQAARAHPGPARQRWRPSRRSPARLLGAFTHGTAYIYLCDVHGSCAATYTDTDVPLLHLRLVVLTDRNCLSACEAFSGAVKDLRLGTLVGTRTAGILSGPAAPYLLNDASLLVLPAKHDSAPTTRSSTASASRPTTTSRSPHKTSPPGTTPTSPKHSPCSGANPHQANGSHENDAAGAKTRQKMQESWLGSDPGMAR